MLRLPLRIAIAVIFCAEVCSVVAEPPSDRKTEDASRATPEAVFNTFRAASAKNDWRTIYECAAPALRDDVLFEAFFASCEAARDPRVAEIVKRHNIDSKTLNEQYAVRYKKEYGVEPFAGKKQGHGDEQTTNQVAGKPRSEKQLVVDVLRATMTDEVGFVAEINGLSGVRGSVGALKSVSMKGDTAWIRTDEPLILPTRSRPDVELPATKAVTDFELQRTTTGWLISHVATSTSFRGPPIVHERPAPGASAPPAPLVPPHLAATPPVAPFAAPPLAPDLRPLEP